MAPEFRQYDEHGFPLPPRFDDIKYQDDAPPARPKINLKTKRLVLILLLVGVIVPAVFGTQLVTAGRQIISRWLISRAEHKVHTGDLPGALSDLGRAIDWNPDDLDLHFLRAQWRTEMNDLAGSLTDWNTLIERFKENEHLALRRNRSFDQAEAYSRRSWVLARLGRSQEAIDDATAAIKLRPSPKYLNSRAYIRAITKVELQEGLDDIDKALAETGPDNTDSVMFLDTRGYLLCLLDRNDEALSDLNRAVEGTEQQKRRLLQQQFRFDMRAIELELKFMDRDLAVMYHHRGLVQEKLGHASQAQEDLRHGEQLGYDPTNGVL